MKFVLKTSFLSAKLSAMKFLRMKEAFFAKHPNPDNFCPEDGGEYGRMDPIYTLTMDVHAGKYAQAEERIMDFRSRGMSSGLMKRHYSIIARSLDLYTCIMYVHCSPTSKRLLSKA